MKTYRSLISAVSVLALVVGIPAYGLLNSLNPDSWWCLYPIYQNKNGDYEVWWRCKTSHIEQTFHSYSEAKEFQRRECKGLGDFMNQSPTGKQVK